MRRALVIGALLLGTPASAEAPLSPSMKALFEELVASAYTFGLCERYVPPAEADGFVGRLGNLDGAPGASPLEAFLSPLLLNGYAEGRADAAKIGLTVESCTRLLSQQGDLVAAAHARARSEAAPR